MYADRDSLGTNTGKPLTQKEYLYRLCQKGMINLIDSSLAGTRYENTHTHASSFDDDEH